MCRRIILITWTIFFVQHVYAVLDPLAKESTARPIALGNAFIALANDASAIFVNPAGLAHSKYQNFISAYAQPASDTNLTIIGWSSPGLLGGTLGFGYRGMTTLNVAVSTEAVDYSDQDITLAYIKKQNESLYFSADLRYLSRGLSKDIPGYEGLYGSGTSVDLGFKHLPNTWLTYGLALQSLGGKINYRDGYSEDVAANIIAGLSITTQPTLTFNLDLNKNLQEPLAQLHLGLEWRPLDFFSMRLGADQTPKTSSENYTHITTGFGLKVRGVTFDYALKKWTDPSQNLTHYFSLGYVGPDEPKPKKVEISHFLDVPPGYWARKPIEALASLGIMNHYQDDNFYPERPITRAEAVTYLVRAKEYSLPKTKQQIFTDVPTDFWAADYIQTAWEKKLTLGCPDKTFRPRQATNRVEEAIFLARFDNLETVTPEANLLPYSDLLVTHWGIGELLAACNKGLFEYIQEEDFSPERSLTRAEFAVTLYKTGFIKQKLKEAGL